MSYYENISRVWNNLEESYQQNGKDLSRVDFVKKLLLYSRGESGFRSLVKSINDDHTGVDGKSVEQLIQKLTIARENLKVCIDENITPSTLAQFTEQSLFNDKTVAETGLACCEPKLISLERQLTEKSLIPVSRLSPDGYISKCKVKDYHVICENDYDLVQFVYMLKNSPEPPAMLDIISFYAKALKTPMIILDAAKSKIIEGSGKYRLKAVGGHYSKKGVNAQLYTTKDTFSDVTILAVE